MSVTFAQVCINAHVTSSACQTFVFAIWNVFMCFGVDVLLRKSKVNYVYYMSSLGRLSANEKILRLHVTINKMLGMYIFHPRYL